MSRASRGRKSNNRKALPLQLKRVIEVKTLEGGPSKIFLDGVEIQDSRLETTSTLGFPFDLIRLDGELAFDTEVWMNDHLRLVMPSQSTWAESVVKSIESGHNPISERTLPESDDDWRASMKRLRAELANHQGVINHREWERLGRMFALHSLNYKDLKEYLGAVLTEEVFLSEVISQSADPSTRDLHILRIDQKIHNFVASSTALKQQAQSLMDAYQETEFGRRSLSRLEDLESNGAVQFVRGLRNLLAHQSLPFSEQSFTFSTEPQLHHFEVGLSVDELLRWRVWEPAAEAFIRASKERVNILSTVIDVFSLEERHWPWVIKQAAQLNKIHRDWANEIGLEMNWVQSLGRSGRPRREWAETPGPF